MSMTVNSMNNLFSSIFGWNNQNSNNSNLTLFGQNSNLGLNLSDYASIKSGAYHKLLKAYYENVPDDTKKTDSSAKKTTQTTQKAKTEALTKVENAADDVKDAADALLAQGSGAINQLLVQLGIVKNGIPFLTDPKMFWGTSVVLSIWKSSGWWAIIFLAAISGIDQTLYEAASIDGAGRLKRIWYITIPGIKGAIITVLILSIGSFLGGGMVGSNFEQSFLMGNTVNNATAEIIQTYAFKLGMAQGRFSYATAVDLVQSMISIVLILISNKVAKKITGEGLF